QRGNLVKTLTARAPPRHEAGGEEGEHQFAALVGARVAELQDGPFRTRLRHAGGLELARKSDGVAGQHRLDPAQIAKARRGSADTDLLAARDRLPVMAL